jgi:hypothetical protein
MTRKRKSLEKMRRKGRPGSRTSRAGWWCLQVSRERHSPAGLPWGVLPAGNRWPANPDRHDSHQTGQLTNLPLTQPRRRETMTPRCAAQARPAHLTVLPSNAHPRILPNVSPPISHEFPGITGIIPAIRAVTVDHCQVEAVGAATFRPLPICDKSQGSTSVFFRQPGSGMPTGNASSGLLHTGTAHFRRPGVALQPGPTVRFPVPGVRKRRGNNHGDPPHATSEYPAEACRDARCPPACGPAPRSLRRPPGFDGIDTGSRSPFPPPGVPSGTGRGLTGKLPMRHARIAPPGLSQPYRSNC